MLTICLSLSLCVKPLFEGNENLCICWEYRYIFYDTFGRGLYKAMQTYADLLQQTGFKIQKVLPHWLDTRNTVCVCVCVCHWLAVFVAISVAVMSLLM